MVGTCSLITSCFGISNIIPLIICPFGMALVLCFVLPFWSVMAMVSICSISCVSICTLIITGSTELGGCLAQIITTPVGMIIMTIGWIIETCIGTICAPIGRLYNLMLGLGGIS